MVKVFDHWDTNKGWMSFPTYEKAKSFVNNKFHEYWLMDKDNCCTVYMEIYHDGNHEIWCAEMGGWSGCGEDTPDFSVYFGTKSDFPNGKFTELKPRVDYILI